MGCNTLYNTMVITRVSAHFFEKEKEIQQSGFFFKVNNEIEIIIMLSFLISIISELCC